VDGILADPFALDPEGYLEIPDRPGLGIALDREKLGRYTPDPGPLFG
jgi:L-alanine-DL-glutamate epimerase-like enolase superfamily enzyme